MMIQAIGHFALSAAVLAAAAAIVASAASLRFRSGAHLVWAQRLVGLVAVLFTVASGALIVALLRSDFRFEYVAGYTERALPVGYKLAAFWAGQEGSLLLWGWLVGAVSAVAAFGMRRLAVVERAASVATLAVVCGFFAALLLFAADPFAFGAGAVPADGRGLNPMLQDPGMIIHPPLLFMGYAGFTVPFAVLIGVLAVGRRDNRWIAEIRRWLLVSWLFLTAGIVLGAWWAYVELGWGGYWAWDPVENASLLPWLTGTALFHSIIAQQHRGMFKRWNATLIALTFILCIFGTYLTRSGVIQSVHSFAPSLIGTFFLGFIGVCVLGSIGVIAWRWRSLRPDHEMEGVVSREGAFLLGNVLLLAMMLITLIGTTFPILSGLFSDEPITVKPPFYNKVVAPIGLLLVALMALGPVLAFGRSAAGTIARRLVGPALVAIAMTVVVLMKGAQSPWALICVFIATLGTATVIVDFARSWSARRRSTGERWATAGVQLIDRDHRRYGGQLAHLGAMMLVIGVAGSSLFSSEELVRLHPGESFAIGSYQLRYAALDEVRRENFTAVEAVVEVRQASRDELTLRPQVRFYDAWEGEPNTEVAVRSNWREDLYLSLVGWQEGGREVAIKARINPVVLWIWLGGIVMVVGATFCALPRLLPAARRAAVAPADARPAGAEATVELEAAP